MSGNVTHGHRQFGKVSRTYASWEDMKYRCKKRAYADLDITYPKAWEKFEGFIAEMGECPEGLTLERLDNNMNYSVENCCWASKEIQAQNRSTTKLTLRKVKLLRALWKSTRYGVSISTFISIASPLFGNIAYSTLYNAIRENTWRNA